MKYSHNQLEPLLKRLIDNMVYIKGGTFLMGSFNEDAKINEEPVHSVTLPDYMLCKYTVTNELWSFVMCYDPSAFEAIKEDELKIDNSFSCKYWQYPSVNKGSDLPVNLVSWNTCKEFIKRLDFLTGLKFNLPTEAQWEFAAKGGNESCNYRFAGSNVLNNAGWYYCNSYSEEHAVGLKQPNELGIYDLSGNVWEICQDDYTLYTSFDQINPSFNNNSTKLIKGGSRYSESEYCRVSTRESITEHQRNGDIGLRLCCNQTENFSQSTTFRITKSFQFIQQNKESDICFEKVIQELCENMVFVDGGSFFNGGNYNRDLTRVPKVSLSEYYINKYPVTQREWLVIMGSNPSYFKGLDCPVENINHNDCIEFIKRLKALTGINFDFPSEIQWEFAAMGGDRSCKFSYSGSNNFNDIAWFKENSFEQSHPVGQKNPNILGIYDLSGNVAEWCKDDCGPYNNIGPSNHICGGSWNDSIRKNTYIKHHIWEQSTQFRYERRNSTGLRLVAINLNPLEFGSSDKLPKQLDVGTLPKSNPFQIYCPPMAKVHEDKPIFPKKEKQFLLPNINVSNLQRSVFEKILSNMVDVSGGKFLMGSDDNYDCDDHRPVHEVILTNYQIGKFEITNQEWDALMETEYKESIFPDHPKTNVSWFDCQKFINRLSLYTGVIFSLPTEAQWEFAARGGIYNNNFKYSGSSNCIEVAWCDLRGGPQTYPVGGKKPNELGIYDMSGNVYEWCNDWYGAYNLKNEVDPQGIEYGSLKIARGGYSRLGQSHCRVSSRERFIPKLDWAYNGFRLCINGSKPNQIKMDDVFFQLKKNTISTKHLHIIIQNLINNMILVHGDFFHMGYQNPQDSCIGKETLVSSYTIGKYPVLQSEWDLIMGDNPSHFKNLSHPVENINWHDCQIFIQKLNEITGLKFCLPTEVQWEFAARGGIKRINNIYSGSNTLIEVGWYIENSNRSTSKVGLKKVNELGIFDMSGNVQEWCQDIYPKPDSRKITNPQGAENSVYKSTRGGSWAYSSKFCKVYFSNIHPLSFQDSNTGFRLCLKIE